MSIKLSDTQLVMLSAAAQRDDRCLTLPEKLKGAVAHRVATKLIAAGLVEEVKAKTEMPVWRRDEQDGQSYALRLTAAGAKAIAVNPEEDASPADEERSPTEGDQPPTFAESDRTAAGASASESAAAFATPHTPRLGTKLAQAIEMLRATEGATVTELSQAMGWLPHTTRAVLTGLRKRGYALTLDRSDAERGSAYRIVLDANAAQEGTAPTGIEPPVGESIDGGSDSAASPAPATATRRSRANKALRAA
jgi:DNA-binding MarR family transcriptional regulator